MMEVWIKRNNNSQETILSKKVEENFRMLADIKKNDKEFKKRLKEMFPEERQAYEDDSEEDFDKRFERIMRPCPFCGGKATLKKYKVKQIDTWSIGCERCGYWMYPWQWNEPWDARADAVTVWNKRMKG